MSKTIVYVVALVIVTLIAGTLLGVVLSPRLGVSEYGRFSERSERMRDSRHAKGPRRFEQRQNFKHEGGPLEKLTQILNLSADQKEDLAQILKNSRQEVEDIQQKTKKMFMEIKKKTDVKIREILTPEQQAKFDKLETKLEKRMREGKDRPRSLDRDPGVSEGTQEDHPEPEYRN